MKIRQFDGPKYACKIKSKMSDRASPGRRAAEKLKGRLLGRNK
jgi:hypothetical protein